MRVDIASMIEINRVEEKHQKFDQNDSKIKWTDEFKSERTMILKDSFVEYYGRDMVFLDDRLQPISLQSITFRPDCEISIGNHL